MTLSKQARALWMEVRQMRQEGNTVQETAIVCELCGTAVPANEGDLYQTPTAGPFNEVKHLCHDCANDRGWEGQQIQAHR